MPGIHQFGSGDPARPIGFVIGCGGAGCNTLQTLPRMTRFEPVAVNDMPTASMAGIPKRLLLSKWKLRGLAEVDDGVMRRLRSEEEQQLETLLGRPDLVFVIAGLGGDTGSWGSNVAVRVANAVGAVTIAIVNTPFKVEGPGRQTTAAEALRLLGTRAGGIITYPNEGISKITPHLPLGKAFGVLSHFMTQPITMLSEAATVDDLRALAPKLRRTGYLRFGAGEGHDHESPAPQAVDAALGSPWFDAPVEDARLAVLLLEGTLAPRRIEQAYEHLAQRLPEADLYVTAHEKAGRTVTARALLGFR